MNNLPERFFEAARRVLLKESDKLDFQAADILRRAQDTAMHAQFREMLRNEVNNPQLGDIVVHYLDEIASERTAAAHERQAPTMKFPPKSRPPRTS